MTSKSTPRKPCSQCDKGFAITICIGCDKWLCRKHFDEHRSNLGVDLDGLIHEHNQLLEDLIRKTDASQHPCSNRIDQWEKEAIKKIKQAAKTAKLNLDKHLNEVRKPIEKALIELGQTWQTNRDTEDFSEIEIGEWSKELTSLKKQLQAPSNITIENENINDDNNILPMIRLRKIEWNEQQILRIPNISNNARWKQTVITVAGGESGHNLDQLDYPYAFDMDHQGGFYICDYDNNRIVFWKKGARTGQLVIECAQPTAVLYDGKEQRVIISEKGNRRIFQQSLGNDQKRTVLVSNIACRGLALDREGFLYASNYEKHEVRRYRHGETNGTLVAGGNGQGDRLDQFDGPSRLLVDNDQSIFITDYGNHRIMKWRKDAREGMVVAGGRGPGDSLKHLKHPRGLWIDSIGSVIVADSKNNRIMRWLPGAQEGKVIVEQNQLDTPMGLCLDAQGNIYVADSMNFCIRKFELESTK